MEHSTREFTGRCFCGAVELRVAGEPAAMGFCHCSSCREWSAGPINAFTLWPAGSVSVTRGAELLQRFAKTPRSGRQWCAACGGHVMTEHPEWGLVDVYAATLRGFPFEPQLHVHYGEAVLRVRDGLPKLDDLPEEMGGSGAALPE